MFCYSCDDFSRGKIKHTPVLVLSFFVFRDECQTNVTEKDIRERERVEHT